MEGASEVIVRVGGRDFLTTLETLEQGGASSYFLALLRHDYKRVVTRSAAAPRQDGGETRVLKVDRDPALFEVFLAFMRTQRLPAKVRRDYDTLTDLEAEAEFYLLEAFVGAVAEAKAALEPLRELLRAFSITTGGTVTLGSINEVEQVLFLENHELAFVSSAVCTTRHFTMPRKHHDVFAKIDVRETNRARTTGVRRRRRICMTIRRSRACSSHHRSTSTCRTRTTTSTRP